MKKYVPGLIAGAAMGAAMLIGNQVNAEEAPLAQPAVGTAVVDAVAQPSADTIVVAEPSAQTAAVKPAERNLGIHVSGEVSGNVLHIPQGEGQVNAAAGYAPLGIIGNFNAQKANGGNDQEWNAYLGIAPRFVIDGKTNKLAVGGYAATGEKYSFENGAEMTPIDLGNGTALTQRTAWNATLDSAPKANAGARVVYKNEKLKAQAELSGFGAWEAWAQKYHQDITFSDPAFDAIVYNQTIRGNSLTVGDELTVAFSPIKGLEAGLVGGSTWNRAEVDGQAETSYEARAGVSAQGTVKVGKFRIEGVTPYGTILYRRTQDFASTPAEDRAPLNSVYGNAGVGVIVSGNNIVVDGTYAPGEWNARARYAFGGDLEHLIQKERAIAEHDQSNNWALVPGGVSPEYVDVISPNARVEASAYVGNEGAGLNAGIEATARLPVLKIGPVKIGAAAGVSGQYNAGNFYGGVKLSLLDIKYGGAR